MTDQYLFSILIPTWNNLEFLKICVRSIRQHSAYRHQIIVHVNDGSDGTLEWVRDQGLDYTYTKCNVGVCVAMNMMRSKVKTDYILYMNDDMYVLPGYDEALYHEIKRCPDNRFFLSATTIQPHGGTSIIAADYGNTPATFREDALLNDFSSFNFKDYMGATLPPNIVHRDIWDLVGGYSVELSPGMYSDPDFTAKLWICGVRYMKGVSASRVYHFESKTTARISRNNGSFQFLLKWGITSSAFRKIFTHKGQDYDEKKAGAYSVTRLRLNILRSRVKALCLMLTHDFGSLWKFWEKHI